MDGEGQFLSFVGGGYSSARRGGMIHVVMD